MRVLYATDGSDAAGAAGRLLTRLGEQSRVEIVALAVAPAGVLIPDLERLEEKGRLVAHDIVDRAVEDLGRAGFAATGRVAEGFPGEEIVRAVEEGGCELTVLGAGNRSRLGMLLLGSTSMQVLHASPSSVLVVHRFALEEGELKVLLGTDGSEGARLAERVLSGFAHPGRCRVTVTSVAPPAVPPSLALPGGGYLTGGVSVEDVQAAQDRLDEAAKQAEAAAKRLSGDGFRAEAESDVGYPLDRLLEETERRRFDLVAVGSRGHGPIRRRLLGSVSDQLARYAPATLVARVGG